MKTTVLVLLLVATVIANDFAGNIWPLSKSTTDPDLIQTSPFGPRIKKSENRYDWHRGVDIPCTLGDPMYAIADGTVVKSGTHSAYRDPLVQVKHTFGGKTYYVNYMHAQDIIVAKNQQVTRGQQLCGCGASKSGFAHLHFEVRKQGLWQKHCINPWSVLPHPNTPARPFSVELENKARLPNGNWNYDFKVIQPENQLTFNGLHVEFRVNQSTSYEYKCDFEAMNYAAPKRNASVMDNPIQGNWHFDPEYYGTFDQNGARYTISLQDVPLDANITHLRVHILTIDANAADIVDLPV